MHRSMRALIIGCILLGVAPAGGKTALAKGSRPHHAAPKPIVALTVLGDGKNFVHHTGAFHTPTRWTLNWTYNCTDTLGRATPFGVVLARPHRYTATIRGLEMSVNVSGRGTSHERGAGWYSLRVVTPCFFHVEVRR